MTPAQTEQVGHYVLGLLEGHERDAFEADMARDPALAKAVSRLQGHFERLDDTAGSHQPGDELWRKIEAALEETAPKDTGKVVPLYTASSRRVAPYALAASLLLALGLGVGYLAGSASISSTPPLMIAVLINETDATPGAIVEAFADDSIRLIALEEFEIPVGQILEVWTLPDAQTGPVSLGTFRDADNIRLIGPALPNPQTGQLYEITLEPAPGSPTGRPTGPIIAKGFAKAPI